MAGVFIVLGLGLLLKLGFWQVERLAWKEDILDRIETNMALEFTLYNLPFAAGLEELEYLRICTAGEFLHDKELYVYGSSIAGQGGVLIYTPLKLEVGEIIINRGWVPNQLKEPENRKEGQVEGLQKICGVLRLDRKKSFVTPDNNPDANRWFTPIVGDMAKSVGIQSGSNFFLEADNTGNPGGYPVGGQTLVNIPNNHLGYAITWFGLALTLLGVFGAFVYAQKRKK